MADPEPTTGAPAGVPVVDLTATVAGLREHAGRHRRAAERVMEAAWHQHRTLHHAAQYLDQLATTLDGGTP